jgi:hypothetical protein
MKGDSMKNNYIKSLNFMFTCLIGCALFNLAQAATQPTVSVQSYAKHVGSNTVYTYRVTNYGPKRLFSFNIGCNCTHAANTNSEPQLVIYPVEYDFDKEYGGDSVNAYSAPTGWSGGVARYEGIDYVSFEFEASLGSEISLLPGYTETFSIITPTIDNRDHFSFYVDRPEGAAFFYDKNKRGYLSGHYSYREDDAAGKSRVVSYPMELIDKTPPSLTVSLNPATLWPPNDKLVSINATITAKDDYDPEPEIKLESITATEPLEAGDIQDAQFGTDDRQFSLAAKRAGNNQAGRIYTVTYSATDASGNKATASATVTVPHDQGK